MKKLLKLLTIFIIILCMAIPFSAWASASDDFCDICGYQIPPYESCCDTEDIATNSKRPRPPDIDPNVP